VQEEDDSYIEVTEEKKAEGPDAKVWGPVKTVSVQQSIKKESAVHE